ncbi:MAG: hypothetical protein CME31_25340 [Gimesia sp.]|jgi:hypothetical protein|uniref:Uncharacterized protein n=1 Tax=Gimesia maris TaxID=122 RepID=A0A3D3R711_9PLAN|nr:hypothetical protein [Gimesia sp.]HCO24549.1 hypothetical protein [Gimesia maris]|tara:strand:- start:3701 stop:4111 length:411 start_codon:yes stop_codon:yes gene_type:complete
MLLILSSGCIAPQELHDIADLRVDQDRCHIHNEQLKEDINPVENFNGKDFNRVSYTFDYTEVWRELFPYAFDDQSDETGNGVALVKYCPGCRAAKEQFVADYPILNDPEKGYGKKEGWGFDAKRYIKDHPPVVTGK